MDQNPRTPFLYIYLLRDLNILPPPAMNFAVY